ncbi:protein COFACTOR ASSEMBLY OF COMPLEX C SUBUNIT B CCB2, chloroplastic isoform X2 [Salvia miltiorrhiza]|uniref:protein COFACTOR ASSEMBLY OF COMPLEX C SUBUNIT B CCB2, chloroplastic isoform X2 n=1 Tax=Salvia miltiorrhiza TaxID=226208 RepID=UPI0025ACA85F|nr:protein COFACTOR ASSEMBLY OF COMPLEX C SUBUNIT B CCB2, chloroplastic isoform X2 [Salvia miltiorrhiza]
MSSCGTFSLSLNPLIIHKGNHPSKLTISRPSSPPAKICCSQNQQQPNLSVLLFTLGIPGLDESYLPRYIGYGFGALLVLNHFLGSDSSSITPAQLRTEALGLSLASFSAVVPYLGKFLKGATPTTQKNIPEGVEQIFVMSQDIAADLKEDLAWGTYVLLRNTNSISVLISVEDAICVRGYWSMPKDLSKDSIPDWFRKQTQRIGLSELKDAMYLQQSADSELKEMVPVGTRSLLVQPIREACELSSSQTGTRKGFILLASGIDYAFTDKDKAWIASIANKFSENVECVP